MIAQTIDWTADFNAASNLQLDISNWDYILAQFVSPSGAVSFKATNDGGAITGVTDGNAVSATNFTAIQGTDLSSGSGVSSVSATKMIKFNVVGRYIQFSGSAVTATKLIIYYAKIS